jgi:hypothetical protein
MVETFGCLWGEVGSEWDVDWGLSSLKGLNSDKESNIDE